MTDMINFPPHYTDGGLETIDFIEAKGLNYHLGNVVKYVSRAGKKGSAIEDLKKARWYLDRAIALAAQVPKEDPTPDNTTGKFEMVELAKRLHNACHSQDNST